MVAMQVPGQACKVASCGLRQPPRLYALRAAGPVVHRGCIHFRHASRSGKGRSLTVTTAAQSEAATVQTNSATSTDDSAVPVVSENASAEIPHSEVATQDHLEAAHQKSQAGRTDPTGASAGSEPRQASQGQAPPTGRSGLPGRSAGRSARRPRTVRKEQLVQGAEFEGTVVSVLAYGAFVDIGSVTDGLVHVSQMTDSFVSDPSTIVKNGQVVNVRVSSWDENASRLSLTMRLTTDGGANADSNGTGLTDDGQARRNPRQGKVRKGSSQPIPVSVGDVLKDVKVQSMLGWGAFIDVGNGHRGLLHVDEMRWPEGAMAPSAYDCVKEEQSVEVRVLKIAGGKIQLTMKTEEERKQESDLSESGVGADTTRKARTSLEAALAKVGFKHTPKPEAEAESDGKPDSIPSANGVVAAEASANSENQATVQTETNEEKAALDRQINPKGSPTPMELPPEAQKAADESGVDEAAMEGDDSSGGTADQSNAVEVTVPQNDKSTPSPAAPEVAEGAGSKEGADAGTDTVSASAADLDEGVQDDALQRQTNPKGSPTPMELPPEAEKAAKDAQETALEGTDDKVGTADKSNTVEVTAPSDTPSAKPEEVAEGEEPPAVKASANGSPPSKESDLPSDPPPEVGEGENPDAVGQEAGTLDESDTVEVTGPPESDSAPPAEVAEGEESPAAAQASSSQSAEALSGAGPASGGGGSVSALSVKQLRQETGAGMMDCKRALTEANGDIHLATEALRKKGLAAADKKAGRVAAEGLLAQYIHAGSRLGVLVEVNCETDFVARGDVFKELANDMAMQVAACSQVTVVDSSQVPTDVVDKERNVQMGKEDILKKPEAIRGKIVDGRIQKFLSEQALLDQAFIKDTSKTVATVIKEATATVGEKVSIRRFERFQLGEGITKKESDLAADVEQQQQALQNKAAQKKEAAPEAAAEPQQSQEPAVKVDAKLVKQLRESSGAGMMDCKKALANNDNNLEKATEFLRKKGLASADKKAGRVASEGAIGSYVHAGSKLGVLIEVNCETDFVARGAKFKELVQDMAMQAAASPSAIVVALQDVPEAEIEKERAIEMGKEDIQSKPEAIRPKIVEGRLNKIRSQKALLEQPFIKDTGNSVAEHIKAAVANLGENIQIRRFVRYNLGEGIEKKSQDFAAEVAAQTGK
ncbi:MAG: elongation factor Ts, partial [Trebouxia sp. A1-2]